jgi:hypothetical protein
MLYADAKDRTMKKRNLTNLPGWFSHFSGPAFRDRLAAVG